MEKRGKDAKVPDNIVEKKLSNLCSCEGVVPDKSRYKLSEFVQMVLIHKDDLKSHKRRDSVMTFMF